MNYAIDQQVDILCHDSSRIKGTVVDVWMNGLGLDIDPGDGLCEVSVYFEEIAHDALLDASKALSDDEEPASTLEDYKNIGKEGGVDALALVGKLMQDSADSMARMQASLYEGEVAAHEETKRRLYAAEDQNYLVKQRVMNLLFGPPTEWERIHLLGEQS